MKTRSKLWTAISDPGRTSRVLMALGKGLLVKARFMFNPRVTIGPGFRAYTIPYISGPGRVVIEANVVFSRGFLRRPCVLTHTMDSIVVIGRGSVMGGTRISCVDSVRIGAKALVGSASILDSDVIPHPEMSIDSQWVQKHVRPIEIGERVWAGINSFILAGSHLGDECVVGAGAVVCGLTAPAGSILAGNPARRIGATNPE